MTHLVKRKSKNKIKLSGLLLAVLLIYFSYITIEQQKIIENKDHELTEVHALIAEETKLKAKLGEQFKAVNTDEYLEKAARQKLGFVKEGERVFIDINK